MEAVGGDDSGVQRFATRAAFALGMGLVSFAVYSHQDMTAGALAGYLVAAFLLAGPATASFLGQQVAASTAPQKRRKALSLAIVLVGLNALALNFWLAPVGWVRADLTANGEYSVGETTARVLADLDEPLEITGYFSAKTHPLLAPLVPRIQNLLAEYQVVGGRKLKVSFVDPNTDEEIENEINETYGIKPVPFRVSSRHEKSVVNSYFHLLVRYGDEHQVLGFDKLIEVYADTADVQVELRNLEYDLTRAIKKVTQGFQSIESMLARHDKGAKLTAYITPDLLPEEFKDVPERLKKVADELAEKSGGRFRMETVDPGSDPALQQELYEKYRFKPMAADLFGTQRFYMHLLFEAGDHAEQIFPQGGLTEADLRTGIEAAIKRSTPGFLKTVGLLTEDAAPPPNPYGMPPQGPTKDFQRLEQVFSEEYEFKRLDLSDGVVPGDVDVLIVAKAGALDEKEQFALDQYLMRGGAMIVLSGAYDVSQDMKAKAVDPSLLELLKSWGVEVETGLVMDPQNARFPVPVEERRGPLVFQRIVMMDYPFFPDVRRDGHKEGHVALQGVPSVAVTWASPVKVKEGLEDLTHEVLLRSGPGSTLSESTNLQPDMDAYPATGFAPGKDPGRKQLAVSLSGTFQSHFADKPSPLFTDEEEDEEEPEAPAGMPPGMPNFNLGSTTGEDGEMPLEPPAPVAVAEAPASDGVSAAAPAAEAPSGGAADAAADASVAAPAAEAAEAGAAAAAPASDGVAASAPAEDAEASGEGGDAPAADGAEGEKEMDRTGRTLKASTPDARLVVVGSSSFASDMIASLDFRSGTDSFAGNLVLARNLVDWSLEDTELLQIRSVGRFARTLRPMKPAERTTFEVLNYVVVLVALFGVGVVAATRRRMARPIPLV